MKKTFKFLVTLLFVVFAFNMTNAQQPQVTLKVTNFTYTDSIGGTDPMISGIGDAMTFDVYLLVTGGADPFQYALGQYYFDLNVTNPDGTPATLLPAGIGSVQDSSAFKYRLVAGTTDFPAPYQTSALPRNPGMFTNTATNLASSYPPGVSGSLGPITNSLRVNSNASLGGTPTFLISNLGNGTRLSTFRLKKLSGSFAITNAKIQWRQNFSPFVTSANPVTKIFYYTPAGPSTEILFSNINYVVDTIPGLIFPVELASFTAASNRNSINLSWSTTRELNNSGYDVERKLVSATEWAKVGFVNGNGTTNDTKNYTFTDRTNSGRYNYRLKQIDFNGNFEYFNLSSEIEVGVPTEFALSQNYPNPFNPSTKINYDLPKDGLVSIALYDLTGRQVASIVNEVKTAGYYTVQFNASNLSSGMYFYRITSGSFVSTKKMALIK